MESVPDLLKSTLSRWRAFSPMQRTIFGLAAGVILIGFISIGFQTETIHYVPLSLGKQFSAEELTNIEQTLREQSLTTFRREGNQLLVPENEQTAYDAVLLQERRLPQDWASEWEQKFEQTNPFTSSRKLRMMEEIARAKELKRIIQGLDGIKEANVVWAESESHSWPSRQQKVTASVNIRPEPGIALSEQTIRAIQFSVANMVPNLEPQDVIVLDCSIGRHYQLEPEQARFDTDLQRWIDHEVSRWQERLSAVIVHHWPEAQLLVRPRLEELRQVAWQLLQSAEPSDEQERSFRDIQLELQRRFPEYMHLAVTIPAGIEQVETEDPAGQISLDENVYAALIGWLPQSFEGHQLQVTVESHTSVGTAVDVARAEPGTTSWQPVIMVGVAGILLLLVSRRFQSPSASDDQVPQPNAQSAAPEAEVSTPRGSSPPATPLGDPELVADVLKQWLGTAGGTDDAQSPVQD